MNLKGFKKVHDDDEKAVLKNSHGHSITIAKKALSPQHLKNLGALPLHAYMGTSEPVEGQAPYAADAQDGQSVPAADDRQPADGPRVEDFSASQRASLAKASGMPDNPDPTATPQDPRTMPAQTMMPPPGDPNQPVETPAAVDIQKSRDEYIQHHTQLFGQEAAKTWQDMNSGHITPKTYADLYANKSTLGKIGTIFGLMLSGVGSGMAHQENLALKMMDNEIQRDFEAQKASKDNARNLYKAYQEHQLNKANIGLLGAQTELTKEQAVLQSDQHFKNSKLLGALGYLQGSVDKLPDGPQKMQQQQTLGKVKGAAVQKIQQDNLQTAGQMADMNEARFLKKQNTYKAMAMLGMPEAKGMMDAETERHVPGFGDSTQPIPADVRQELIAKKEYDQAAKAYVDFANQHKTNWANLNPKDRLEVARRGAVLGAELQGKYRMKTHGGVYKTGEQEFIQKIIPDNAAKWDASFNNIPKVQQTISDNESDTSNLAKGNGLPFGGFGTGSGQSQKGQPQKPKGYPDGTKGTLKDGTRVEWKSGQMFPVKK